MTNFLIPIYQPTIIIVLLLAITPSSKGDAKALMTWVNGAKPLVVKPGSTYECIAETQESNNVFKYTNRASRTTMSGKGVNAEAKDLVGYCKYTGSTDRPMDPVKRSETLYLPWKDNKATYRFLQPAATWPWFYTDQLSGCDVWVADATGTNNPMAIVHINSNTVGQVDPVANLRDKEAKAMETLGIINRNANVQYRYIQRISYDYAKKYPDWRDRVNDYWNQFHTTHPQIPYFVYYPTTFGFFYGRYVAADTDWHLNVKDLQSGKVLKSINCDDDSSSCTII